MKFVGRAWGTGLVFFSSVSSVIIYLLAPQLLVLLVPLIFFIAWYLGKKYDQVKYQADRDFLTSAYNRHVLLQSFPKLYKENLNFTVIMIDIDNFKFINDSFGHEVGDVVLRKVAHLLIQNVKNKGDMVIRWGGDEFLLLFLLDDEKGVDEILGSLRTGFQDLSEAMNMDIQASIGWTFCANSTQSITELIRTADMFMYQQKNKKKII